MLFGGGSAELLLLDEADVLESGIDMIALVFQFRNSPPGSHLRIGIQIIFNGIGHFDCICFSLASGFLLDPILKQSVPINCIR